MSRDGAESCSVLVIGGSGFLGQHVISVLQSRAPFVTAIRTLDIVPYENKLDHAERVPVKAFTGSMTDVQLVEEACRGVNLIIHVAAVIDISMFPDMARTTMVNIEGPSVVMKVAAESPSCYGYVFSSSVSVHFGTSLAGSSLTEDSPIPEKRYYEPYATSKIQAERLVMDANGPSLKTAIIRPSIMYGELDWHLEFTLAAAARINGWLVEIKSNGARQQQAYVGNVAWGFVCAAKRFHEQRNAKTSPAKCDTGTGNGNEHNSSRDISGEVFVIADDSEPVNQFENERIFLEPSGLKFCWGKLPLAFLIVIFQILYLTFKLLSLFGIKQNFPYSTFSLKFFYCEYIFSDKKARDLLGYTPLFDAKTARQRSIGFYRKRWAQIRSKC